MNTPGDEPGDEVTRAYRRASDAQAGRPAPATRAAILAEARAATLRRTPAANDSRYAWRAVAGLAVLGVAVLLWRQADRHVSPDLTVASTDRSDARAPGAPAAAPRISSDTAVTANEAAPKAERAEDRTTGNIPAPREREDKREGETPEVDLASAAVPATNSLEKARADAALPSTAGGLRQDASNYQGLVQREFPEIWNGESTADTVWVVMDADGKVARKGVLAESDTLASVASQSAGRWSMVQVKTASGSSLQLAVLNVE